MAAAVAAAAAEAGPAWRRVVLDAGSSHTRVDHYSGNRAVGSATYSGGIAQVSLSASGFKGPTNINIFVALFVFGC